MNKKQMCCGNEMLSDGSVFDPSRGKMAFYRCSVCGSRAMVFSPVKPDQTRAFCGDCDLFYRRGCFAAKPAGTPACDLFREINNGGVNA